jgi:hypothetical protein
MKKDFTILIKELRLALQAEFKSIVSSGSSIEEVSPKLSELENKQDTIIKEAGYDPIEFLQLMKEYFMDFSSPDPNEWVIRHDPENAQIIASNNLSYKH